MKELIIKVDDPGERAWDGSHKTFEIQELIRCKDCKWRNTKACFCKATNDVKDEWFCSEGQRMEVSREEFD